jgi:hypothetical protein
MRLLKLKLYLFAESACSIAVKSLTCRRCYENRYRERKNQVILSGYFYKLFCWQPKDIIELYTLM